MAASAQLSFAVKAAVNTRADLQGAYLQGAADYKDGGVDVRGYHFRAVIKLNGIEITAGCRCFTLDQARTHWKDNADALARVELLTTLLTK